VEFRHLQNTRLRVTLVITGDNGRVQEAHNTWNNKDGDVSPLEASIRAAQREVVDHEIFAALVREAATLPTATASVSEQLTTIEAAQGIELRFELVCPPLNLAIMGALLS
jgi:mediator of RNA polymerase II transcription subunit 17, fungi type